MKVPLAIGFVRMVDKECAIPTEDPIALIAPVGEVMEGGFSRFGELSRFVGRNFAVLIGIIGPNQLSFSNGFCRKKSESVDRAQTNRGFDFQHGGIMSGCAASGNPGPVRVS